MSVAFSVFHVNVLAWPGWIVSGLAFNVTVGAGGGGGGGGGAGATFFLQPPRTSTLPRRTITKNNLNLSCFTSRLPSQPSETPFRRRFRPAFLLLGNNVHPESTNVAPLNHIAHCVV